MEDIREIERLLNAARLSAESTASLALATAKVALPIGISQLVHIARELARVADHSGVSNTTLLKAADQLHMADVATRAEAVSELIHESIACARDAGIKGHDDLIRRSVDLALAGRCYLRVAALVKIDGRVAAENNKECKQPSAAKWWWYRSRPNDVEESLFTPLIESTASCTGRSSSFVPRDNLSEQWLNIQLFMLTASLCLFVYMGPDGVLKNHKDATGFSPAYLWWVNLVFICWWGMVCLGILCSLHGVWWIERQYARVSGYLGMFGLVVLVAMFSHTIVLGVFLVFAFLFFAGFYIRSCKREDT